MPKSGREHRQASERDRGSTAGDDKAVERAVRALQAGAGPEAYEPIFNRFYRPLFKFFANQPALREEADDLTQDTLFRAFENIGKYSSETCFGAWLRRIGENVWKNAVRKKQSARRGAPLESLAAIAEESAAADQHQAPVFAQKLRTPEQLALTAERTRVLHEALDELPPGMRRCTELRLGHDLKYQEIADVTGIGLNSVRSQLFEARKRLRPVLDSYFNDADF